jgi:DNA-directed RNA polymerase subunit RPC12/RpoP
MEERDYDYEVAGEVIKMIHDELPAVRWTCGGCGEDTCTILYDREAKEKIIQCETCSARNLVRSQL